MKSLQKSINEVNSRQLIVFKLGLIQVLCVLLMLFFFLRCSNPEPKPPAAPVLTDTSALSSDQKQVVTDSNYVAIASHLSDETKAKLIELEKNKFSQGNIASQLMDYLKLGENDLGVEFKFMELRFENKKATYNEKFAQEIIDLATIMNALPNLKIKLMAYTDNTGEESANEKLTEARAMAVKNKLMESGVAGDRIEIKALGEKYPVGDNKTYVGQMINNRIEMMILRK